MLPSKPKENSINYPTRLLIYGQSKVGKTTQATRLKNNLILDLESGTSYVTGGYIVDVKQEAKQSKKDPLNIIREVYAELVKGGHQFKYVTFDTVDNLEVMIGDEIARENGVDHYTDMAYGKGYALVKDGVLKMLDSFHALGLIVIVIGHRKKSISGEEGKEVKVVDFDLSGKLKNALFAWADAIGYMHRVRVDTNLDIALSFRTDEFETLEGGCRIPGLHNQTIAPLTWDKIFPQEKINDSTR
jgi:hypothetical protein